MASERRGAKRRVVELKDMWQCFEPKRGKGERKGGVQHERIGMGGKEGTTVFKEGQTLMKGGKVETSGGMHCLERHLESEVSLAAAEARFL